MYVAVQHRDSDMGEFFKHETCPFPPSLTDNEKMRFGKKSDLLKCLREDGDGECEYPQVYDCTIFDAAALVHALSPNTAKTFDEYAEKIFIPYLHHQTRNNDRIDVVWDVYRDDSIKTGVREKRGDSARKKITGTASIPHPWQNFLCNSKNKEALFSFISTKLADTHLPEGKTMYVTKQETVFSIGTDEIMENSNHEEADTRMIVHLFHALKCGCKLVQIRTVDTDVIVFFLACSI